jgi:hypothetical protein
LIELIVDLPAVEGNSGQLTQAVVGLAIRAGAGVVVGEENILSRVCRVALLGETIQSIITELDLCAPGIDTFNPKGSAPLILKSPLLVRHGGYLDSFWPLKKNEGERLRSSNKQLTLTPPIFIFYIGIPNLILSCTNPNIINIPINKKLNESKEPRI